MPEYTIEELQTMLDQARQNEADIQIVKNEYEIVEEQILSSEDFEDETVFSNDNFHTLICHIWKSQLLNKSITKKYLYIEEIENNQIVGRRRVGDNMEINEYDYIPNKDLIVVEQKQAERGF